MLGAALLPDDAPDSPEVFAATHADDLPGAMAAGMPILARALLARPELARLHAADLAEALMAEIDTAIEAQLKLVMHHADFRALEATWRGLLMLAFRAKEERELRLRALDVSKRELTRTLRKYRGGAWDQSPIFRKIYEEEYGQFGGEPFGLLVGDYAFDHAPEDVALLEAIGQIAASAHAPFLAAAAPSLMQMETWAELANPRDPAGIFATPEYVGWRSLRRNEDSRYLGLCLPRMLMRLPYGHRSDPVDAFAFEEACESTDKSAYLWGNPAYAMAANIMRAFALYGWCAQIRGVDSGGAVEDLPVLTFPSADGRTDRRCPMEVAISEHREAALANAGLMALVYRKNSEVAAFISAQSLQTAQAFDDPDATASAVLSTRLPYMLATCRFAHYVKCYIRDRIGASISRVELQQELNRWIGRYVDRSGTQATPERRAACPLSGAKVTLQDAEGPGQYLATFQLSPRHQLDGMNVAVRLVSRVASG